MNILTSKTEAKHEWYMCINPWKICSYEYIISYLGVSWYFIDIWLILISGQINILVQTLTTIVIWFYSTCVGMMYAMESLHSK